MAEHTPREGPKFVSYLWPVVDALKTLGGSARPAEVRDQIAKSMNIADAVRAEAMSSGLPRFDNQVGWARFYLAKAGLIDASSRGVWSLTEKGRELNKLSSRQALDLFKHVHDQFQTRRTEEAGSETEDTEPAPPENAALSPSGKHREVVLERLRGLPPGGFERFCQRLLRESGFQEVRVTGRSGDGGIDGIGILQVSPLVSFKVLFQCKRYSEVVTPSHIRDFRGAMQGRADKGIFLTTGRFTPEAKREAIRDGVPAIELVDGGLLVTMLEKLSLGLCPVQSFEVSPEFFEEFEK
ncbi:MAG: restriction endonuclease [Planctomycetes bacterium]|nr:restriction endonuclease [Planctomycetota bacterium]